TVSRSRSRTSRRSSTGCARTACVFATTSSRVSAASRSSSRTRPAIRSSCSNRSSTRPACRRRDVTRDRAPAADDNMPRMALTVPVLVGSRVRLEPLTNDHADGIVAAAGENRETYAFTSVPHGHAAVDTYLREIAAGTTAGETLAFAQVRVADDAV